MVRTMIGFDVFVVGSLIAIAGTLLTALSKLIDISNSFKLLQYRVGLIESHLKMHPYSGNTGKE